MKVVIFFGNKLDIDVMRGAENTLKKLGVPYDAYVLSAHRVPKKLIETLEKIGKEGCEVIITGARLAVHLPGVIASHTIPPVIGVPVRTAVEGMDALLSIVQMPKSIPVAAVGINNNYDAGMLAIQMPSLKYPELRGKLIQFRIGMKHKLIAENGEGVEL